MFIPFAYWKPTTPSAPQSYGYLVTNDGDSENSSASIGCIFLMDNTNSTIRYFANSTPVNGNIVYTDSSLSTPYNGGGLYYGISYEGGYNFGTLIQISTLGVIASGPDCGF